jgi:stearoyl-CoA desaturase (Delta-9 desaturase)
MTGSVRTAGGIELVARRARFRSAAYRIAIAAAVFVPLLATFFAIWRLWGHLIGGTELTLFVGLYVATGLGVSIGFHRLLSHGSFECGPVVKATFVILGSMAGQGRCIGWVAHHRKHHAYSDRPGDPHSPLEGFVHAYFGWVLRDPPPERERYCRRLLADPLVSFIDRTMPVWLLLGLAIPFAIGGWDGLLWGGFVRMAFFSQVAYSVNSFGHSFGSRPFQTKDESRNNWILALLGFGDGWHNNHHAFPSMAYHGMTWRQVDPSGLAIRTLAKLGLAWNVKLPSEQLVERRRRTLVAAEAEP